MNRLAYSAVVIGLCVCCCAWSQAPNLEAMDIVTRSIPDGPVARVGKTSIEKIDFILLYQSELSKFVRENPRRELADGNRVRIALLCINILLEQELLYQESILKKLEVDEDEVKRRSDTQFEQLQKGFSEQAGRAVTEGEVVERLGYEDRVEIEHEIERAMLIAAMRKKIVSDSNSPLSEKSVLEYYEKNKDDMKQPALLHLRHISIRGYKDNPAAQEAGLAKAKKALDRIYSGQLFETVAQEYSELLDPKNGSDLGVVPAGSLPEFMVRAAVNMEAGDVSEVLESDTGLHIIQLVSKGDAGLIPEEEALEAIRGRLAQQHDRLLVREYCDVLISSDVPPVRVYLELEQNLARIADKKLSGIE